MSTTELAVAVACVALVLHGAAAAFMARNPVSPAVSNGEPRTTRAATGSLAALAYLVFAAIALGGVQVTGHDGITASSLTVFGLTQAAWLISTTWDVATHARQAKVPVP